MQRYPDKYFDLAVVDQGPGDRAAAAGGETGEAEMHQPASALTHLSLFTGIGGLDLAAEWAGFRTVGQCEFADYPTRVLEKHWPGVPRWRDVRDVTGISVDRTCGEKITVISGGFPCQPHSLAGKRLASADERDLWGEFARVICEVSPKWVVAENVPGLLSSEHRRFFGRVLRDLAGMGYDVGWGVLSAFQVGAPHLRKRICIVAHANCLRWSRDRLLPQISLDESTFCPSGKINPSLLLNNAFRVLTSGDDTNLRGTDGIPREVDELRCLGNAVVPQQFYPIFAGIAEIERTCANG